MIDWSWDLNRLSDRYKLRPLRVDAVDILPVSQDLLQPFYNVLFVVPCQSIYKPYGIGGGGVKFKELWSWSKQQLRHFNRRGCCTFSISSAARHRWPYKICTRSLVHVNLQCSISDATGRPLFTRDASSWVLGLRCRG